MDTPPPDQPAQPDPTKPSRLSLGVIVAAALVVIPGLCFGVAMPLHWESVAGVLLLLWLIALFVGFVELLVLFVRFIFKR